MRRMVRPEGQGVPFPLLVWIEAFLPQVRDHPEHDDAPGQQLLAKAGSTLQHLSAIPALAPEVGAGGLWCG